MSYTLRILWEMILSLWGFMRRVSSFYSLVLTNVGFLGINFHISKEMPLKFMEKPALITRCHQKTLIFFKKNNNLWNTAPNSFWGCGSLNITAHTQVFTVLYLFALEPSSFQLRKLFTYCLRIVTHWKPWLRYPLCFLLHLGMPGRSSSPPPGKHCNPYFLSLLFPPLLSFLFLVHRY